MTVQLGGEVLKVILPFTASHCVVVPGYCSASVSTETTLGSVTMVIGEDGSRWELYFQNLNILLLGTCVGNEGEESASSEGGRSHSFHPGRDGSAGDRPWA